MSLDEPWTPEQRAGIEAVRDGARPAAVRQMVRQPDPTADSPAVPDDDRPDRVSSSECAEWRRRVRDGETTADIAREDATQWSDHAVGDHARGRCKHPVSLVGDAARVGGDVTRDECDELRARHDDGESVRDLRGMAGRSSSTIRSHLTGECDHAWTVRRAGDSA